MDGAPSKQWPSGRYPPEPLTDEFLSGEVPVSEMDAVIHRYITLSKENEQRLMRFLVHGEHIKQNNDVDSNGSRTNLRGFGMHGGQPTEKEW